MQTKTALISGAGIAGPTLAYWLRRAGFEPTVIERSPQLRTGGYVIDFWGLGYDIAEAMGLENDMNAIGYRVRELRVVDNDGKRLAGFGTSVFQELTGGRYITLARSDLSRLIFEKVKEETEFIFGDEISAIHENADGVRTWFGDGTERHFRLLIGADGLHSNVRRLAFGRQPEFEEPLGYAVAAFEIGGYRPRNESVYIMHGMPGRTVGRFTLRNDRTLFVFVFIHNDTVIPQTLDMKKALLRKQFEADGWETDRIINGLADAQELYFDRVSQIKMHSWSRGKIALVGDAAFCPSLLAGQGSALAMVSAYVMAGELLNAGSDYNQAFARYEAVLRDFTARKQQGAKNFATAFAPRTYKGLWFRNLVIKAFSIPGVAHLTLGGTLKDELQLPTYHWTND